MAYNICYLANVMGHIRCPIKSVKLQLLGTHRLCAASQLVRNFRRGQGQ